MRILVGTVKSPNLDSPMHAGPNIPEKPRTHTYLTGPFHPESNGEPLRYPLHLGIGTPNLGSMVLGQK